MNRYKIKVEQIVLNHYLRMEDMDVEGCYLRYADNEDEALDIFHSEIPISRLEDFQIEVEQVGYFKEESINLFTIAEVQILKEAASTWYELGEKTEEESKLIDSAMDKVINRSEL